MSTPTTAQKCDFRLAADIMADCRNMSVKGLGNSAWIMNFDDIDREASAYSEANINTLTALVLKSGAKAYNAYVPGKTPFTGTNKALAVGTYVNTWTKQVNLVVLNEGPDVALNIIDKLSNGRFVVIMENKTPGDGGKATYEVYGFEAGLAASAITNDKYSEETNGGYAVTLEETGANKSGVFLYSESLAATKAVLDSLVAGSETGKS